MKYLPLCTLTITLCLIAASALSIEYFDEYKYCRDIAKYAGGSYSIEEGCRKNELEAKRALAGRAIPRKIEQYCHSISETVGGSNSIMKACIENELAAKQRLGY